MPAFFVVGAGAACGALARYLLAAALGAVGLGTALPLLIINVLGSALMGYIPPSAFWGTGVLGGFTSFATFAYLTSGMPGALAALYVMATLVGCAGAYVLGRALPRRSA